MDFQSRINQFRQNMDDQQSTYSKMAESASQIGRTVLPDKTAQHYAYMEQVGGLITGSFATYHGGIKLAKRIKNVRNKKLARQNNKPAQQSVNEERADEIGDRASAEEAQGSIRDTQPAQKEGPDSLDPSEEFDTAESRARGGKPRALADSIEDEPEEEGGGASPEDFGRLRASVEDEDDEPLASFGSVSEASPDEVDRLSRGFSSAKPEDVEDDEPLASFGNVEEASPDEISRFLGGTTEAEPVQSTTQTSTARLAVDDADDDNPFSTPRTLYQTTVKTGADADAGGSAGGRAPRNAGGQVNEANDAQQATPGTSNFEEGAQKFTQGRITGEESFQRGGELVDDVGDAMDSIGSGLAKVGGAIAKGVRAVGGALDTGEQIVKQGVSRAVGAVAGETAGAVASEAVPFLGEAVGLGMLIRNIVRAHKHEENAKPVLSAPTQEATEQAGGIESSMLKMSSAPSIY